MKEGRFIMKISKVKIRLSQSSNSKLKAYAFVSFDSVLTIRNIRIVKGKNDGLFVIFPNVEEKRICKNCKAKTSYKDAYCRKCGVSLPVILPSVKYKSVIGLSKELREEVVKRVLEEYKKVFEKVISGDKRNDK